MKRLVQCSHKLSSREWKRHRTPSVTPAYPAEQGLRLTETVKATAERWREHPKPEQYARKIPQMWHTQAKIISKRQKCRMSTCAKLWGWLFFLHSHSGQEENPGSSLVAQWLGFQAFTAGGQVQSLGGNWDPASHVALPKTREKKEKKIQKRQVSLCWHVEKANKCVRSKNRGWYMDKRGQSKKIEN